MHISHTETRIIEVVFRLQTCLFPRMTGLRSKNDQVGDETQVSYDELMNRKIMCSKRVTTWKRPLTERIQWIKIESVCRILTFSSRATSTEHLLDD